MNSLWIFRKRRKEKKTETNKNRKIQKTEKKEKLMCLWKIKIAKQQKNFAVVNKVNTEIERRNKNLSMTKSRIKLHWS